MDLTDQQDPLYCSSCEAGVGYIAHKMQGSQEAVDVGLMQAGILVQGVRPCRSLISKDA